MAPLAFAVSRSLAAGTDVTDFKRELQVVADPVARSPFPGSSPDFLLIRVGFMDFGVNLETAIEALKKHIPAAVWYCVPGRNKESVEWT